MNARCLSRSTAAALLLFCGSSCSGSDPGLDPPVGATVEVQLRRDALGGAGSLPVSPTVLSINGVQVGLSGSLSKVTPRWLVVRFAGKDYWVSRDSILLVAVTR